MSLIDLAPANTKRARENASRTSLKLLADEEVAWDYLETCMKRDIDAQVLGAVVDKFGIYLAFKEGRKGQLLARHSVMQYVRQAKNWLLGQFPQHRALVDKNLLKKGQMLERHCMKRETGAFVKKAPACTKTALKKMMEYLYSTAVTAADYQDAVLANLSVGSGKIFFVRFNRIKTSEEQAPGVHSYVNRVLDRIAEKAGAQHVNGAGLRAQWIFDRGAWNMTATNKAFAYVFNTPAEDHQVARALSGRDPDQELHVLSLDVFDSATQTKIHTIAVALFNASYGLKASQYNVNGTVLDTLMVYLLRHYPSLKKLNENGLPVKRLEAAHERSEDAINEPPAKRRRTGVATNLRGVWFTWYAHEPRIWSSTDTSTKHTRSTSKQVAAFLKLFLADGFALDPKSPQYRDDVLELGTTAEKALLSFLTEHKIKARGAQNVLKSLRKPHKTGHLDERIRRYKQLQVAGRIVDPAPVHTTNIIGLTGSALRRLTPSAYDDDDTPGDFADEERKAEPFHYVEKLLNWKREKRVTYYLVD
uniref:Uncharacterized protein n=1 Tax=Phytophthora ramorum TaxID=164328 RepID=H3GV82_PHYRM